MKKTLSYLLVPVSILISQTGCMSAKFTPPPATELTPELQTRFAEISIDDAIGEAEKKLKAAYQAEMSFYSPRNLKFAEQSLNETRRLSPLIGKDEMVDKNSVLLQIIAFDKALDKAEMVKVAVQSELRPAFEMQKALDVVNAAQYDKGDYGDLIDEIGDLIAYVEADQVDTARKKLSGLIKDMTEFETETILYNHLNAAELALDKADDLDADDLAPKTFEFAEKTFERAESYIEANPHDNENVERLGKEALFAAKHAIFVAKAVEKVKDYNKNELENVVLNEEQRLLTISEAVGLGDIRDRSLLDQTSTIVSSITEKLNSGSNTRADKVTEDDGVVKTAIVIEEDFKGVSGSEVGDVLGE